MSLINPPRKLVAVTKSDSTNLKDPVFGYPSCLYVGTAGTLNVTNQEGNEVTLTIRSDLVIGVFTKVRLGGTANDIVAGYN